MTNHYWDRVTAPHADRDRTEPPIRIDRVTGVPATIYTPPEDVVEVPAGLPLHESADRDADNVPSDEGLVLVGERWEDAARRWRNRAQQLAQALANEADHFAKAEATNARVEALAAEWDQFGEDSAYWRAFGPQSVGVPFAVEQIRAALRGPEPTEATSNEDAPGLDVGADAPSLRGPEPTEDGAS